MKFNQSTEFKVKPHLHYRKNRQGKDENRQG